MLNKTKTDDFAELEKDIFQFFACRFQTVKATKKRLQQDCRSFDID